MLLYALLQTKSPMKASALELIFRGYGMAGGMMIHEDLVLVQIRDETFRDETHVKYFFASLKKQGLKLLLLTEPNPDGLNEIFYPKRYGKPKSPQLARSDKEADRALQKLCDFLATTLGREWRHKQRIWKNQRHIPCA